MYSQLNDPLSLQENLAGVGTSTFALVVRRPKLPLFPRLVGHRRGPQAGLAGQASR
jgi:hypothetical protein